MRAAAGHTMGFFLPAWAVAVAAKKHSREAARRMLAGLERFQGKILCKDWGGVGALWGEHGLSVPRRAAAREMLAH